MITVLDPTGVPRDNAAGIFPPSRPVGRRMRGSPWHGHDWGARDLQALEPGVRETGSPAAVMIEMWRGVLSWGVV